LYTLHHGRVERKTGRWRQPGRLRRGQTDRQADKRTNGQADREEGKRIVRLTKIWADRRADTLRGGNTDRQTEVSRGTFWMTKMISDRQAERRACKQTGRLEEGKGRGRLTNRWAGRQPYILRGGNADTQAYYRRGARRQEGCVDRQTGREEDLKQTCRLDEGEWRDRLAKARWQGRQKGWEESMQTDRLI
jgi:hypothetical protein